MIILVNLNNREKAALFLLIPFCMVLGFIIIGFIINGLKGIVKNYRNRDSAIHFKSNGNQSILFLCNVVQLLKFNIFL